MKQLTYSAVWGTYILLVAYVPSTKAQTPPSSKADAPPVAPIRTVTEDYHGIKLSDRYSYMENLEDPSVQSWFKAQDNYTRKVVAGIPGRDSLLARIREVDQSTPEVQVARLPGDGYLILKRLPNEDVAKLYIRQSLNGEDKLLVDPENVKLPVTDQKKGKNTIQYFAPSQDSKYVAVGVTPGGAEIKTEMHVFDMALGRETGDVVTRAWGSSPNWLADNRSFVYTKLQKLPPGAPETEVEQKSRAYLHVLGTDPEKDRPLFGYGVVPSIKVDPAYFGSVTVQPGWRYAIGSINSGVSPNSAFYVEPVSTLGETNSAWRKIADFDDGVQDIEVHGDDLYVMTFKDAPRYKILRMQALKPDLAAAETVLPAGDSVVQGINPAKDALYVELLTGDRACASNALRSASASSGASPADERHRPCKH